MTLEDRDREIDARYQARVAAEFATTPYEEDDHDPTKDTMPRTVTITLTEAEAKALYNRIPGVDLTTSLNQLAQVWDQPASLSSEQRADADRRAIEFLTDAVHFEIKSRAATGPDKEHNAKAAEGARRHALGWMAGVTSR